MSLDTMYHDTSLSSYACKIRVVSNHWLLGISISGVRFNNEQSSKNCVSMSWVGLNKRPQYGMYVATVLSTSGRY